MGDFINLKDDLISRSKLLMHLNDYALQEAPFKEDECPNPNIYNAIRDCMKAVEDAPTVEAVPVVCGEWEKTRLAGEWICNKCQSVVYAGYTRNGYKLFNFCPECGADMRRKVQDGKVD